MKTERTSLTGIARKGPTLLTDRAAGCLEHKNIKGKDPEALRIQAASVK